ncbi:MAG TPA: maleylpyruvate isomerase family mycothiol-dependent enzyme [Actinomycetes bacterium]|jgi:uncharacterized protein (TIGR03083 family)|nr:maleylpyruvate isomerase family mycothiol-dependent enzyme [Actinomycetes bacterium]
MERDIRSLLEGVETTHGQVGRLLADLPPDAWTATVPASPAWSVGDVVSHLAEGERAALAVATGRPLELMSGGDATGTDIDRWTAAQVSAHAGEAPAARLEAWEAASDAWRWHLAAVEGDGWRQRVPWVLGPVALRTLAQLRLHEAWLHGRDIAEAVGAGFEADQATLAWMSDLAVRVIPGSLSRRGRAHPGAAIMVRLSGAGEWLVGGAVGERPEPGREPDLVLEAEPLAFVLRAAGRARGAPWRASGDQDLASDVGATLYSLG